MTPYRAAAAAISVVLVLVSSAVAALAGTVTKHSLRSEALGRDYDFTVYLPDGYADSGLSYPAFYLLHGANGNENEWVVKGGAERTLDRLIAEKRIQPVIVVMPGHFNGWWVDGNRDKGETALYGELMPAVEKRFRTITERGGRGIGGLSAGGYGAIRLALKHPDRFAAAVALSPAIYAPLPPNTSSATRNHPFVKDGKFDPETWQRLNWPALIDAYTAQPVKVPFYINSGDHDRFDIAYHAAVFYQKLREHQASLVEFRVVDGDHEWPVWEATLGDALVYALGFMSRPQGAAPAN